MPASQLPNRSRRMCMLHLTVITGVYNVYSNNCAIYKNIYHHTSRLQHVFGHFLATIKEIFDTWKTKHNFD